MHNKTAVVMGAFVLTIAGWFAWQGFLSGTYARQPSPYAVRDGFAQGFGRDALWWGTVVAVVLVLAVLETAYKAVKRRLVVAGLWRLPLKTTSWTRHTRRGGMRRRRDIDDDDDDEDEGSTCSTGGGGGAGAGAGNVEEWHLELWQELEKDPAVRERLRRMLEDEETGVTVVDDGRGGMDETATEAMNDERGRVDLERAVP